MRIVDVSFIYDEGLQTVEEQLKQHYTSVAWVEAIQRAGAEVISVKRFSQEKSFTQNDVQYYFFKDRFGGKLKPWQVPYRLLKEIARLNADVVHLHGFGFSFNTILLRSMLKKKTAIVVQDHSSTGGKRKYLHQFLNRSADGYFFTSIEQGEKWLQFKSQFKKIMPVIEGCPLFNYEDRDHHRNLDYHDRNETRKNTSMNGDPVFLWVGRLLPVKDPLTVLNGFEILFEKYPDGKLFMIYADESLLNEVKEKINSSSILKNRVQLLGRIDHEALENYYHSADYFVLGSLSEGTCYSLSEALSCGCIPIITAIPTFKTMTNNGQLGALWEVGNKNSFVEAAMIAMNKSVEQEAKACIDFFKNNLSYKAIAKNAILYYEKAIAFRQQKNH
jgi:glycosyltransferase involved in cell wall biosynthesis